MKKKDTLYIDGLQFGVPTRNYFEQAKNAGLDLIHVTLVFWENMSQTMELIGDWFRLFDSMSDLIYPALSINGLSNKIGKENRIGVLFGFQNCSPIENNIDFVEIYRRLNVGIMQLSYNNNSLLCGGCYEKEEIGISRFGREVIREMNRVGMIIDMSHSGIKSTLEAIEISERPICITHAQSLTFKKSVRNKPDPVLTAISRSGGMLGLSLYPFHLKNTSECSSTELMDEITRLVDLMGIDAIGFGTDICQGRSIEELVYMRNGHWTKELNYGEGSKTLSGWPEPPQWFRNVGDFAQLENRMLEHGFTASETDKIMGKNWFNFLKNSLLFEKGD